MFKINRLYTEPKEIEPLEFKEGLNFILGERDSSSNKNNGVGKSLCIEFINFALLKKKAHSRVSLIPEDIFSRDTKICLDFSINNRQYTIKRSLRDSEKPTLFDGDNSIEFAKLEDATKFFTEKIFENFSANPSFRTMIGLLIRDERSEFKSIVGCYDTKLRLSDDYSPHLYLFGLSIDLYEKIKTHIKQIKEIEDDVRRIKENVLLIRRSDIDETRSDLNELDREVKVIENSIDKLENIAGYEIIRDEINNLEIQIDEYRRLKTIYKQQLAKLNNPISQTIAIDTKEISEFYESLKDGLGKFIVKDLQEVLKFKSKIDQFQKNLLNERSTTLIDKIRALDEQLLVLDKQYSNTLLVLDQKGDLKNLKQTYSALKEKSSELVELRGYINRYDELLAQKQRIKSQKESDLLELQSQIQFSKETLQEFEKTILDIHEFIQGNSKASFDIKPTSDKQVVKIVMRIDDDGSHDIEHEKVFIYDIALLLNNKTKIRHPGFLVHDNIFDVDQDTLTKSLDFLDEKAIFSNGQQYILTLNSDRLPDRISNNISPYVRARFTKSKRFLNKQYQEYR